MIRLYLLILYLSFNKIFCQNNTFIIVDNQSNKPIPYVAIKSLNNNKGIYANKRGEFLLNELFYAENLKLMHISYEDKIIDVSKLSSDSIFLKVKRVDLEEVLISNKNIYKTKEIGLLKKTKNLTWHINSKQELATSIKYNGFENSIIKKIKIPIGKGEIIQNEKNSWKKIYPKFESVFKVKIYEIKDNFPSRSLINKPIIVNCNQNSDDIIVIDISDERVMYPKEGVFISIEMIGSIDKKGNLKDTTLPSFKFTKKTKKNILSKSYIKYFYKDNKWKSVNESLDYLNSTYNLAIGLTLDIYED